MEEKDILEMRQQLTFLREKLEDQQIVNDHLMRVSMRQRSRDIKRSERFSYRVGAIALILYPIIARAGMFSILFCTVTCLMMLFCIGATVYVNRPINRTDLMTADLATVAAIMKRFRRQSNMWIRYVTPTLIIPWLTWACCEYLERNNPNHLHPAYIVTPLIMGAAIGGFIGYRRHRTSVQAAEDILEQIEK